MISPLKPDKEKNQRHLMIKKNLRSPSIKKKPELILCTLNFIVIYLNLLEIWIECLMREHTKQKTEYAQAWSEGEILHVC